MSRRKAENSFTPPRWLRRQRAAREKLEREAEQLEALIYDENGNFVLDRGHHLPIYTPEGRRRWEERRGKPRG